MKEENLKVNNCATFWSSVPRHPSFNMPHSSQVRNTYASGAPADSTQRPLLIVCRYQAALHTWVCLKSLKRCLPEKSEEMLRFSWALTLLWELDMLRAEWTRYRLREKMTRLWRVHRRKRKRQVISSIPWQCLESTHFPSFNILKNTLC